MSQERKLIHLVVGADVEKITCIFFSEKDNTDRLIYGNSVFVLSIVKFVESERGVVGRVC